MVLADLRRSARIVCLLLLASFWGLTHRAGDDPCVAGALQAHDESRHVIGAPGGGDPDHCAICHSIRTPRPFGFLARFQSSLVRVSDVALSDAAPRRAPALDKAPARAPPATLL
jgi:hypothetical protein